MTPVSGSKVSPISRETRRLLVASSLSSSPGATLAPASIQMLMVSLRTLHHDLPSNWADDASKMLSHFVVVSTAAVLSATSMYRASSVNWADFRAGLSGRQRPWPVSEQGD